jgi:tRNA-splicing ligase RtcB
MLHSGSRNFGLKIAKHYNKIAQQLCAKWYSAIPTFKGDDGLAFLPIDTTEGKEYIDSMNYALLFARENRLHMINRIKDIILSVSNCTFGDIIDIHHNYAQMENHFGANVMVHRKGATSARLSQIGIIPGSQGTSSYIVEGLGKEDSFQSCSHGAGRAMSRTKAQETLRLEDEVGRLDKRGILHAIRGKKDLDEASGAYKDIDLVMSEQSDLVKVLVKLEPLAVIKG